MNKQKLHLYNLLFVTISLILVSLVQPITISQAANFTLESNIANCKTEECYINAYLKGRNATSIVSKFESDVLKSNGLNGLCNNVGRKLGRLLYLKYKDEMISNYPQNCGHAISYGMLEEMGKGGKNALEEAVKYCLKDLNVPSCTYGVGLALSNARTDSKYARDFCEKNFAKYDHERAATKSFQMSARGDCYYGYISSEASRTTLKSANDIKKYCGVKVDGYTRICSGVLSYSYLTQDQAKTGKINIKLVEVVKLCDKDKNFECMQFVGKNIDALYTYVLKYDFKKDLVEYQKIVNKICNISKPCVEGMIQSHIVHTSHAEVLSICRGLRLREFCETTTREHV